MIAQQANPSDDAVQPGRGCYGYEVIAKIVDNQRTARIDHHGGPNSDRNDWQQGRLRSAHGQAERTMTYLMHTASDTFPNRRFVKRSEVAGTYVNVPRWRLRRR